jgi:predicted small secreted protein
MRKVGKILCLVAMLAGLLYALGGCETWAGVGKDIQRGGSAIEESAN